MKRFGTPYVRGKSEVIRSYRPKDGVAVAEGLFVGKDATGTLVAAGTSVTPKGVSGVFELRHQSIVEAGLETYVRLADGAVPKDGLPVYVTADGKATHLAQSGSGENQVENAQVNASFVSGPQTCRDSKGDTASGAAIDFVGGL